MKFKYYRRGTGELDTSNFPAIAKAGYVEVHHLGSREMCSLIALNTYMFESLGYFPEDFTVVVTGYVAHMRADKDLVDQSYVYKALGFKYNVQKVQHDSRNGIQSATIDKDILMSFSMLNRKTSFFTRYVGADSSVHKFFPDVDVEARKVRENGKVVSLELDMGDTSAVKQMVIVDDILGGGATIQMCVDRIRQDGYKGDIYLWTEWNEGIHSEDFLKQFAGAYIGENIYEVN